MEFALLMEALRADYPDTGDSGVLRQWQVETAALKILTVRRGTRAQRGAWNAAVADSLFRRLVDRAALVALKIDHFADLSPDGEPIESKFRRSWHRERQQIARAAVAGDPAAIKQIRELLGSAALESDSAVDFIALYTVQAAIDRVARPAQADAEAAFRSLEKQRKRAARKQKKNQTTARVTGPEVLDLGAPEQISEFEQVTTTNPPTVVAPKATGDDDGGAQ